MKHRRLALAAALLLLLALPLAGCDNAPVPVEDISPEQTDMPAEEVAPDTGVAPPPPVNLPLPRKERNEYVYCPEHQRCYPGKLPVPI